MGWKRLDVYLFKKNDLSGKGKQAIRGVMKEWIITSFVNYPWSNI